MQQQRPSPHFQWPTHGEDRPVIIGIAGGSGSGKTTIAAAVIDSVGSDRVVLLQHDAYYRDLVHLPFERRIETNFDHPDSLETELLIDHLRVLRSGRAIDRPVYDFSNHVRTSETIRIDPEPVVIVEGILVFAEPELREMMDLRIYIDTDGDLRVLRRLQRDLVERGRSVETVINQYMETVRPMHLQFVEPSKRYADIIVPEGYNESAVGTVTSMIRDVLAG
ncbi:MAG TPA: uridine kinase [Acidimicrobiia bacterium]|jgi:uridine kinase|nr:uridine kinase [Acidimicrobiia bacterium]